MDDSEQGARSPASTVRTVLQGLLGAALLFTGTAHLGFARDTFRAQVPPWLPLDVDLVVVLSGLVELAIGAALMVTLVLGGRSGRALAGLAAAALFVAVFPGNITQYVEGRDAFGLDTDRGRLIRLAFQPLLIAWALWSTGAWGWARSRLSARRGSHSVDRA